MDPRFSAQDVMRCDLCETPVPPLYCDFCHTKLCKACVGEHLSDFSKEHKVVPFKQKGTTPNYPNCVTHIGKLCELHCKACELPVCLLCLSSNFHKGHTLLNLLDVTKSKQEAIEKDVGDLLDSVCPEYEEISAELQREKINLEKYYEKLKTAATKQGEDWHREIDIIINKKISKINEMKACHLAALNKQENDIKHIISEVKQCILELKKILDSNDVSLTSSYQSRNAEFRRSPPKVYVSLPSFSPGEINTEQLYRMFGSLSTLSITTEHGYTTKITEPLSCPPVKPILDEPEFITTIDAEFGSLYNVTCISDEEIWTTGNVKNIKLYNIQGKPLRSIHTGSLPNDIAVTRSGDLFYTDTITVNIIKNEEIQEVIRLRGWKLHGVCSTFSGDLLVTMNSDDRKQSKVVRYSGSKEKQTIQFDNKGKPLYSSATFTKYISENRNLDICVSDHGARAVVVVSNSGKLRFRYIGHRSTTKGLFSPYSITTDSQRQILTADCDNHCIHILDQDGQFIRYIDLNSPWGLCVDTRDNLFVAEYKSCKVKKIKYM